MTKRLVDLSTVETQNFVSAEIAPFLLLIMQQSDEEEMKKEKISFKRDLDRD